jgi:RNA polymerase sigma-70 factor (ECF subfamily)
MDADAGRQALIADLRRVADGDRIALKAIYDATSAKLFGVCLRILNDRSEAEDVLQEVYIAVWTKADRFDPARASPITWLAAIARNRAIDRQRQVGRRASRPIEEAETIADDAASSVDRLVASDEKRRLDDCLSQLEEPHRAAVRTAFFEGRTYEDVATLLTVPLGTLKSWIRRSLQKLKMCLEP